MNLITHKEETPLTKEEFAELLGHFPKGPEFELLIAYVRAIRKVRRLLRRIDKLEGRLMAESRKHTRAVEWGVVQATNNLAHYATIRRLEEKLERATNGQTNTGGEVPDTAGGSDTRIAAG